MPTVLEREGEMERIAATVADGEGAVLPIEGPAGAGKSALVRAAAIAAEGLDFEGVASDRKGDGGWLRLRCGHPAVRPSARHDG